MEWNMLKEEKASIKQHFVRISSYANYLRVVSNFACINLKSLFNA